MMNGANFTERFHKVLELARMDAASRCHECVDPEHILLGLVNEGEGLGAAVLQNLGVDLRAVRTRVEGTLTPRQSLRPTGPDVPYSARARSVLEFALGESRDFNHRYVGSEHLVIAVVRENGEAARALAEAGASLDDLRQEMRRLLPSEIAPGDIAGPAAQ